MTKIKQINTFLKAYSIILLFVFVATICLSTIIYLQTPQNFWYEVEENPQDMIWDSEILADGKPINKISYDHAKEMKELSTKVAIITIICILGIVISNKYANKKEEKE